MSKNNFSVRSCILGVLSIATIGSAHAVTWSDTSIGYRYGTDFAEPFKSTDITKHIINLTHSSGYTYGTNFLNVDLLMSNDESNATQATGKGTQEAYVVYRNTVDLGKVLNKDFSTKGLVRGYGVTGGFDWNTKNDVYASKKRMWVLGPTVMFDVPNGFFNLSAVALWESNDPSVDSGYNGGRYYYKTHPMLTGSWAVGLGETPLSFEGYFNWIAAKGKNEYGGVTKPEFNIDAMLMYDLSGHVNLPKKTLRVGAEYQYWRNKFGNPTTTSDKGATASTPMVRAEYHF